MDIALRDPERVGAKEAVAALSRWIRLGAKDRSGGDSGPMPAGDDSDPGMWTALDDAELRALALAILVDEDLTP